MRETASRVLQRLLDLAYPPLCIHCHGPVETGHDKAPSALCADCWNDCVPITEIACTRCGLPTMDQEVAMAECEECQQHPPPWIASRSAFIYRESPPLRSMLLRLKHSSDLTLPGELALQIHRAAAEAAEQLERFSLCPVPLHWTRRLRRGFNQSELLARDLAKLLDASVSQPLMRPRATRFQKGSRAERLRSMHGAFRVGSGSVVQGRDFLLIDDVMTTGATAGACAFALLESGARRVAVATIARSRLPSSMESLE